MLVAVVLGVTGVVLAPTLLRAMGASSGVVANANFTRIMLGGNAVVLTLFLVVGWFGKVLITGLVFLFTPSWFENGSAHVHWPAPTFRNFVAAKGDHAVRYIRSG